MRTLFSVLFISAVLFGQEATPERASVPFSDPAKPGKLRIGLLNGGIYVKGYEGKEVVVEVRMRDGRRSGSRESTTGLRRIPQNVAGLSVEEEGNVMSVNVGSMSHTVDVNIQVPMNTSLKLGTVNDGDIKVDRVRGEIEVSNTNGAVYLTNVSGSVVANALNGDLVVTFDEIATGKAMSFTTLNGKVDVTLPASTKARLSMRTDNGEILSDFEIQLDPTAAKPKVQDSRSQGGRYKLQVDKTVYGLINGGGPEFQFKSFNGNVYIRAKK